jgi:predicted O-methyltransferase YrrM
MLSLLRPFLRRRPPDEPARLAALPRAECDVTRLGTFTPDWLAATFADAGIAADWESDTVRIAGLGIPDMADGVNPGDRRALYYLLRRAAPRHVLEIGTHIGSSTVALALAAARLTGAAVTTADIRDVNDVAEKPWASFGSPASPRDLIASLGCGPLVRFEIGPSLNALTRGDRSFGMIFLDGSHNADMVYREIPLALRRLEPPGLVVLHDYFPGVKPLWADHPPLPGPALAAARFAAEGAGFVVLPLGDLPWPTKLGTRRTSLAILSAAGKKPA